MATKTSGMVCPDERGRISLGKYTDARMFEVTVHSNGSIELAPVILVSKNTEHPAAPSPADNAVF